MHKIKFSLVCMFLIASLIFATPVSAQTYNTTLNVYMFYGQGCPHCSKMLDFFDSIKDKYPQMNLTLKEIYFNKENALLMEEFCRRCNTTLEGVPTVFIGGKAYVGFSYALAAQIESKIKSCIETGECNDAAGSNDCEHHSTESSPLNPDENYSAIGWIFIIAVSTISIYYLIIKK